MAVPGKDENVSKGQEADPSWHGSRSPGGGLGLWEVRLEGEVKARTCRVRQAKKLVLYCSSEGEPVKVLENECDDIIGALPWGHGEPDMGARMTVRP